MIRILPACAFVLILVSAYFYLPARRLIVYKLGVSGDTTTSCCNEDILSKTGDFDESANIAFFNGKEIDYPKTSLAQNSFYSVRDSLVLGKDSDSEDERWIEVSLKEQVLRAWQGTDIVMEFPISSGLWYPTPKGDYQIWYKTRFQRMTGGSKELRTFYDLPNVPSNMFFYKGFAIHGAYWHNNFGVPMSHGCVNAPLANVAQLFEWAGPKVTEGKNIVKATDNNPGTRVYVH